MRLKTMGLFASLFHGLPLHANPCPCGNRVSSIWNMLMQQHTLTHNQLETHGCVLSTVATDGSALKLQALSMSADQNQLHWTAFKKKKISWPILKSKFEFWKKKCGCLRVKCTSWSFVSSCIWLSYMMSWYRHALHITGPLWGESTGDQWIPLTKEPVKQISVKHFLCCQTRQAVEPTGEFSVIWNAMTLMFSHFNGRKWCQR